MNWVWDTDKAATNLSKHGVSFEMAARVFGDPFAVSLPDPFPGEERWRTIGMPSSMHPTVLFVVHTVFADDSGGRIISARRALPHERKAYEEGQF